MKNKIPIVYYHSIAIKKNKNWPNKFLTLELNFFEAHLKFFKKNNFKTLFLNEYFDLRSRLADNQKYVLLTFDDGYVDNYIYAYPLLKKYGFKGTIFVNPEFVDFKSHKRKTLFDYWNGKATLKEVENWGFLSWDEMREMENSDVMDIQSHTLTHTKYFVSDRLIDFHHPGADCLYPVGNLFPERKPYYITDPEFERLIPYGYPFFEQASSVIVKRITISQSFIHSIIESLRQNDWWKPYNFLNLLKKIKPIYNEYKIKNSIIEKIETETEYQERVYNELKISKEMIERVLNKKVEFCCWPHGDNNEFAHRAALKLGYNATTLGKMPIEYLDNTRFDRFGLSNFKNSVMLTKLKMRYKVGSYREQEPYLTIKKIYKFLKTGVKIAFSS